MGVRSLLRVAPFACGGPFAQGGNRASRAARGLHQAMQARRLRLAASFRFAAVAPAPLTPSVPDMTAIVPPALSAAEWIGVLNQQNGLAELREQFGRLPFSMHAIAALLLYEQPFGFTHEDVTDEEEVSEYCAVMAAQNHATGDAATAAKFELLGGRHRERASRIAALLPPAGRAMA